MDSRVDALRTELARHPAALSAAVQDRLATFYSLLLQENERQNLTRLEDPADFVEGHLDDCLELLKSGLVEFPAMDLGSGAGVPGLLSAVLGSGPWILCESEGRKAQFLSSCVDSLGLDGVTVAGERAEAYLATRACRSVVARAVGPVERIYGWIRRCSTWNNLVLLKGPRWEEEWRDFGRTSQGRELRLDGSANYLVGAEAKKRTIVRLRRVPRGTSSSQSVPRGTKD